MRKIKIKKNLPIENVDSIYIGDYQWPNAFDALKGFYLYFHYRERSDIKSATVHPSFIKDVVSGIYDDHDAVKMLETAECKNALQAVACTSFNALVRSNPHLIGWAWHKM